jgi:hypothetical protein
MLFSRGSKNFTDKVPCSQCEKKKGMMHRYALAKKNQAPIFSDELFCSVDCYRRRQEKQSQ